MRQTTSSQEGIIGAVVGEFADKRRLQVVVCACTYKRPEGLKALLEGLAQQRFYETPRPQLEIILADNEGSVSARDVCDRFRKRHPIRLTYIHEPRRGISYARNACLDRLPASCDFFAFIDDDEVPEPNWLEQLLITQENTGADAVVGPVVAVLPSEAPEWLMAGTFFIFPYQRPGDEKITYRDGQEMTGGATCNALVRRASVCQLGIRFEPALGLTGGGDRLFFRRIIRAGLRIAYASGAVTREIVPPERATLLHWCKYEFKGGYLRYSLKLLQQHQHKNAKWKAVISLKIAWGGVKNMAAGLADIVCDNAICAVSSCGKVAQVRPYSLLVAKLRWAENDNSSLHKERKHGWPCGALKIAHGLGMIIGMLGLPYQYYK